MANAIGAVLYCIQFFATRYWSPAAFSPLKAIQPCAFSTKNLAPLKQPQNALLRDETVHSLLKRGIIREFAHYMARLSRPIELITPLTLCRMQQCRSPVDHPSCNARLRSCRTLPCTGRIVYFRLLKHYLSYTARDIGLSWLSFNLHL